MLCSYSGVTERLRCLTLVFSSSPFLFYSSVEKKMGIYFAVQQLVWIDIFTGCITKDLNHFIITLQKEPLECRKVRLE